MGEIIMDVEEKYLQDVLFRIQAPPGEMRRIESDLRSHLLDLREELGDGVSPGVIMERMGTPEEVATEFMSNIRLNYAGFLSRALAFIIDMALCFAVSAFLILPAFFFSDSSRMEFFGFGLVFGLISFSMVIAATGLMILYFPILEGRYGTTLGKHILNLHVVKETGASIGYKEAFLRRIPYYFEFLVIDMLFILFTENREVRMSNKRQPT